MMRIDNVRVGFATNSSSSHSIIFGLKKAKDIDVEDGEFGWGEFCCTSPEAKREYLAQTLFTCLRGQMGQDYATAITREWIGERQAEGYVDHQSVITLPRQLESGNIDKNFFKELCEYYMRPDISIVGGNDNEDFKVFKQGRQAHIAPVETGPQFCRKDGDWWVLFNKRTGLKIRLTFKDGVAPYVKASAPELVDLKITDFCPFGCTYCFQDSTTAGTHAVTSEITSIAYCLREVGVFEVAIGGGEPTLHPDFAQILRTFAGLNITPNFTTRNMKWTTNPEILAAVKETNGRIGVSVDHPTSVIEAVGVAALHGLSDRLHLHHVMGIGYNFEAMMDAFLDHGSSVLLLGFKDVGRGKTYRDKSYDNWLEIVRKKKYQYMRIGIDTKLAQQFKKQLEAGFPKELITWEEGKFSMYIDAVRKMIGPSSYCSPEEMVGYKDRLYNDVLLKIFRGF